MLKIKIPQWFRDGSESVIWNMIGNLIPIYVMLFVSFSENGLNSTSFYKAIHQPFTYLILSGTYLTNAYYIVSKNKEKNRVFPIIYGVLLLLIGLLIKDKVNLENLTAGYYKELSVVMIFLLSFILFVIYQYRHYYKLYNTISSSESNDSYLSFKDQFKKSKDDE